MPIGEYARTSQRATIPNARITTVFRKTAADFGELTIESPPPRAVTQYPQWLSYFPNLRSARYWSMKDHAESSTSIGRSISHHLQNHLLYFPCRVLAMAPHEPAILETLRTEVFHKTVKRPCFPCDQLAREFALGFSFQALIPTLILASPMPAVFLSRKMQLARKGDALSPRPTNCISGIRS
jgi:hypothetical protein